MNYLESYAEQLVDNGFPIVPIWPGEKFPGKRVAGGWLGFAAWQMYCNRLPNSLELKEWLAYPGDTGIGIPCGKFCFAVDIDIMDHDLAAKVRDLAYEHMGETDAVRVGLAPKMVLVYRPSGEVASNKYHPIEILSTGNQFVAYATHPDTGKPYQWISESLADMDQEQLPAVNQEQVDRFVAAVDKIIPAELRPQKLREGPSIGDRSISAFGLEAREREPLADAIAAIPNDLGWDDWNEVGMAIWAATAGDAQGHALFSEFSAKSPKNDPAETDKRWNHFFRSPPSRIGAGTIYDVARRHGWTGSTAPKVDARLNQIDISGLLEEKPAVPAVPVMREGASEPPPPFPMSDLDGALRLFVEFCTVTAQKPQPVLAVAAGLAAIGAIAGRRYQTKTGLRTNLYTVGVAPSGAGKDHARAVNNNLFATGDLANFMGGSEIASGPALISALTRHPSQLMQFDEFGLMLKRMTASSGKDPMADVMTKMMKLFSEAQGVYYGTEYADQKAKPRQVIIQPNLCVHGTTTPSRLYEAIAEGATSDGSLARFLFFMTPTPDVKLRMSERADIPHLLTDAFAAIKAGALDHETFKLGEGASARPSPKTVPQDADADRELAIAMEHQEDSLLGEKDEGRRSMFARVFEHTAKISLVKAISRRPDIPIITGADVRWAHAVVTHCVSSVLDGIDTHYASNEYERLLKGVFSKIKTAGNKGLLLSELAAKTQNIDARKRNDIVRHLQEASKVVAVEEKGKGRPATRLRAIAL